MKINELLKVIELKRKQLIETAFQFGLTHQKTVLCSEHLDNLLNVLMRLKLK